MIRPNWCPHPNCKFVIKTQEAACIGILPEPEDHDGIQNTHRLCMRNQADADAGQPIEWKINRGDAWNLKRILEAAFK